MSDLDDRLLAAHARDDRRALVTLYGEAGSVTNDIDASCFYLTHAYIYALEMGHPDTDALHARLAVHGRV
ncbi:hypothetical protein [Octadecabacter sp. R77987]|uniref:hypothetical protein n=1 Tax=Octadecabacter sp. R77987 TaxID=3093874 RepID=UPI00366E706C